jgi:hypothetical protein
MAKFGDLCVAFEKSHRKIFYNSGGGSKCVLVILNPAFSKMRTSRIAIPWRGYFLPVSGVFLTAKVGLNFESGKFGQRYCLMISAIFGDC